MTHNEKTFLIKNAKIFGHDNCDTIFVRNGVVESISSGLPQNSHSSASDVPVFDAAKKFAGTGLCDMHIHGAGGFDTASPDRRKNLEGMATFLASRGITTFQPTIVADLQTLREISDALEQSEILRRHVSGVYMEGPFIAPEKKGGLPAECIHAPSDTEFLRDVLAVQYNGKPLVQTMTVAPELQGAEKITAMLNEAGVKVAWGHSAAFLENVPPSAQATPAQAQTPVPAQTAPQSPQRTSQVAPLAKTAPAQTAPHITHLFNAMNGLDHRHPGLATVPFLREYKDATFELICDTVHVKPAMLSLVINALGTERLCVISDAMSGAGLGAGETTYLGKQVVCDGKASYYKDSGTLIGSAAIIADTTRDLCHANALSAEDFFRMASVNPRRVLGIHDRDIAVGSRAEIILVDDDLNITDVFF